MQMAGVIKEQKVTVIDQARADVNGIIRIGLITILVAFVGMGGWSAIAPLNGAVVAPGQVKVENSRKTIQHLEGGIVSQILVKEGQLVKQGQPLLILANARVSADLAIIKDQLDVVTAQSARLTAEKARQDKVTFPSELLARQKEPKVAAILLNETRLFNTRRDILLSQIALIKEQIVQAQHESTALQTQIGATNKTIGYLNDELKQNESLAAKGFVATPKLLEFKRNLSEHERSLGEYAADIDRANQKVSELKIRIAALQDDYVKKAADEYKDLQNKVFDLQERMHVPQDELNRQTIVSPVDGNVVGLRVHTIGGVIGAREPIMDIVPENPGMLVEAKVRVEDIDDLQHGMEAEVRLSAYKQRITPMVKGKVSYISADSLIDEATHAPYYLVHVTVDAASIKDAGDNIKLYPGMPAEMYATTRARTALDYFIEPISDTVRHAMREP